MTHLFNAMETSSDEHRINSNSYSSAWEMWFMGAPVLGFLGQCLSRRLLGRDGHRLLEMADVCPSPLLESQ